MAVMLNLATLNLTEIYFAGYMTNFKRLPSYFLSRISCFFLLTTPLSDLFATSWDQSIQDEYIHALASLTSSLQDQTTAEKSHFLPDDSLFTDEDIANLWIRASQAVDALPLPYKEDATDCLQKAYALYNQAKNSGDTNTSILLDKAHHSLAALWEKAVDQEDSYVCKKQASVVNQDFENNAAIPKNVKVKLRPYIIEDQHPMKNKLDQIFYQQRVTTNKKTFKKAGFKTLRKGPRSYVHVARHPSLSGYLVKAYMDDELREKRNRPSWHWLAKRCEGAEKIDQIIKSRKIRFFTVAPKWIYALPEHPSPPSDSSHTRHYALLLAKDMNLVSKDINLHVWSHDVTEAHLNELYTIISRAKGSSYRPDNITFTKQGVFAFIDTEYPSHGPDYKSIRPFLSPDMRDYWDRLVKHGN